MNSINSLIESYELIASTKNVNELSAAEDGKLCHHSVKKMSCISDDDWIIVEDSSAENSLITVAKKISNINSEANKLLESAKGDEPQSLQSLKVEHFNMTFEQAQRSLENYAEECGSSQTEASREFRRLAEEVQAIHAKFRQLTGLGLSGLKPTEDNPVVRMHVPIQDIAIYKDYDPIHEQHVKFTWEEYSNLKDEKFIHRSPIYGQKLQLDNQLLRQISIDELKPGDIICTYESISTQPTIALATFGQMFTKSGSKKNLNRMLHFEIILGEGNYPGSKYVAHATGVGQKQIIKELQDFTRFTPGTAIVVMRPKCPRLKNEIIQVAQTTVNKGNCWKIKGIESMGSLVSENLGGYVYSKPHLQTMTKVARMAVDSQDRFLKKNGELKSMSCAQYVSNVVNCSLLRTDPDIEPIITDSAIERREKIDRIAQILIEKDFATDFAAGGLFHDEVNSASLTDHILNHPDEWEVPGFIGSIGNPFIGGLTKNFYGQFPVKKDQLHELGLGSSYRVSSVFEKLGLYISGSEKLAGTHEVKRVRLLSAYAYLISSQKGLDPNLVSFLISDKTSPMFSTLIKGFSQWNADLDELEEMAAAVSEEVLKAKINENFSTEIASELIGLLSKKKPVSDLQRKTLYSKLAASHLHVPAQTAYALLDDSKREIYAKIKDLSENFLNHIHYLESHEQTSESVESRSVFQYLSDSIYSVDQSKLLELELFLTKNSVISYEQKEFILSENALKSKKLFTSNAFKLSNITTGSLALLSSATGIPQATLTFLAAGMGMAALIRYVYSIYDDWQMQLQVMKVRNPDSRFTMQTDVGFGNRLWITYCIDGENWRVTPCDHIEGNRWKVDLQLNKNGIQCKFFHAPWDDTQDPYSHATWQKVDEETPHAHEIEAGNHNIMLSFDSIDRNNINSEGLLEFNFEIDF